jgi:hypothetical protein
MCVLMVHLDEYSRFSALTVTLRALRREATNECGVRVPSLTVHVFRRRTCPHFTHYTAHWSTSRPSSTSHSECFLLAHHVGHVLHA